MKLAILLVSKHCRNKLDICRHCMYISVCHTFEIIERCIITADSQGLRLQTGGGPPPVARAFALLAASFFFVVPCTSCHFFFAFCHSSGYTRRTNCIYTLKYMKN